MVQATELTLEEHLMVALGLARKYKTWLKMQVKNKCLSLFVRSINSEEKSSLKLTQCANMLKLLKANTI
jgi:hypothetical protein